MSTKEDDQIPEPYKNEKFGYLRHHLILNTPGMRMMKTIIGLFIVLTIEYFRGGNPSAQSAITLVICVQQTLKGSWKISRNRLLGTIFAGIYSYFIVDLLTNRFNLNALAWGYFMLVVVFALPFMIFLIKANLREALTISVITYILICLNHFNYDTLPYAIERTLDTLIGVVVAIIVNWFPPFNKFEDWLAQKKWDDNQRYYITKNLEYHQQLEEEEKQNKKDIETD